MGDPATDGPLLVFGPRSLDYDFGAHHPLTPLRFGPGIDLLQRVGAAPGLVPEPATDAQLEWIHDARYIAAVRRHGDAPWLPPELGIGSSDNPAFPGMHAAAAAVADGSIRAVEAILRGDTLHAHHPGGGLHHAMREMAWGFCIYDDPALAIARARRAGLRVLYLDVDVHHGDGVQAAFYDDPAVLTISFHESGRYLFPGTGFPDELGVGVAAGTAINVPLEPTTGEAAWLAAIRSIVPALAATHAPDIVISQHGADAHAWDPLAHLQVTTTAQAEVARLADAIAHRYASGRWLATGGGGYAVYRVVPRTWALTWLAGAHREPPERIPGEWLERWAPDAARFGDDPLPATFLDAPNAGQPRSAMQDAAEEAATAQAARVRRVVVPRLVREAIDRGWWTPDAAWPPAGEGRPISELDAPAASPTILARLDRATLARLVLARRVIAPADPIEAHRLLDAALSSPGTEVTAAVSGTTIGGLVVSGSSAASKSDATGRNVLAVGVAPGWRRAGLGGRLLAAHLAEQPASTSWEAEVTVAERDVIEPLDVAIRVRIGHRLLEGAGFTVTAAPSDVARIDPSAIAARRARRA